MSNMWINQVPNFIECQVTLMYKSDEFLLTLKSGHTFTYLLHESGPDETVLLITKNRL